MLPASRSGSNFQPKTVDFLGRVSGNYELLKDTSTVSGSPFGFDKFHWINNQIELFEEDRIKSAFNGQDNVTFTDVLQIPRIQQNVPITNENSLVFAGDKSIIQLLHVPSTNVTRVFNVNTGERYTVTNQNIDGTGATNNDGKIRITGNTLPSTSDVLQVDYTWIVDFDPFVDYDGKIINSNPRASNDSIDWDLSNAVRNELIVFTKNIDGAFYSGNLKHPVSVVLSANQFQQADGIVSIVLTGNFIGRLSVVISGLSTPINIVNDITLENATLEIFNTIDANSVILNERVIVGSNIVFNATIILPTDTPASIGNSVVVYFNQFDAFTVGSSVGNFSANQITIPSTNLGITDAYTSLRVSYLANVQDALTASIINLPISRSGNSFNNNSAIGFTNNFVNNIIRRENQTIQLNISSQLILTLNITSSDFILTVDKILTIVNLDNNKELWNVDNRGSLSTDINNNYVLTLTGFNSPQVGDNVVIFYTSDDIKRTQPFTFDNSLINKNIQLLQFNPIKNQLFVNIHNFTTDSVTFSIINPTNNFVVISATGNITASASTAVLSSIFVMFGALDNILFQKVKISNSIFPNNNGLYDIIAIDTIANTITFTNDFDNIKSNQISIVRIVDNKELWTSAGTIDTINNQLILPQSTNANVNDSVVVLVFVANNLRQAPSKLSVTVADQVNNSGIITAAGTTITKIKDIIFTATNNSLSQNIGQAVRNVLGLNASATISSNIGLVRITKLQKVTTTTGGEILSTDFTYDVLGTAIKNNVFYANEMVDNDNLDNLDFILPSTTNNLTAIPNIGRSIKNYLLFYYIIR